MPSALPQSWVRPCVAPSPQVGEGRMQQRLPHCYWIPLSPGASWGGPGPAAQRSFPGLGCSSTNMVEGMGSPSPCLGPAIAGGWADPLWGQESRCCGGQAPSDPHRGPSTSLLMVVRSGHRRGLQFQLHPQPQSVGAKGSHSSAAEQHSPSGLAVPITPCP